MTASSITTPRGYIQVSAAEVFRVAALVSETQPIWAEHLKRVADAAAKYASETNTQEPHGPEIDQKHGRDCWGCGLIALRHQSATRAQVIEECIAALDKYGIGSVIPYTAQRMTARMILRALADSGSSIRSEEV